MFIHLFSKLVFGTIGPTGRIQIFLHVKDVIYRADIKTKRIQLLLQS